MLSSHEFRALLDRCGTLVIDGALASELENRGHDLNHALWSAKLLEENPMAIKQVHLDYFLAGANIAITASYQASTKGFEEHFGMDNAEAMELIRRSARLAREAVDESYRQGIPRDRPLLVAGSVGPYGAYLADGSEYRGDYQLAKSDFKEFHRSRMQALAEADVDLFAIETMPQYEEIQAVLELLRDDFPNVSAWLSCTLKNRDHISDGMSVEEVVHLIDGFRDNIVAFGFNCIPSDLSIEAVRELSNLTALPILIYPNSGEEWNADTKTWSNADRSHLNFDDQIRHWKESGARLVGGCCRTSPESISAISREFSPLKV